MFPYLFLGITYIIICFFYILDAIFAKTLKKENFETYKNYWRSSIFSILYLLGGIFYIYMFIVHRHHSIPTDVINRK